MALSGPTGLPDALVRAFGHESKHPSNSVCVDGLDESPFKVLDRINYSIVNRLALHLHSAKHAASLRGAHKDAPRIAPLDCRLQHLGITEYRRVRSAHACQMFVRVRFGRINTFIPYNRTYVHARADLRALSSFACALHPR